MKAPTFKFAFNRAAFAALSEVEWTPRRRVDADDSMLLVWLRRGYIERRPVKNSYEYRRIVPVPPAPVKKLKPKAKKPVRLPEVYPATWEPHREQKAATPAQLAAWRDACARLRSLPALLGIAT